MINGSVEDERKVVNNNSLIRKEMIKNYNQPEYYFGLVVNF